MDELRKKILEHATSGNTGEMPAYVQEYINGVIYYDITLCLVFIMCGLFFYYVYYQSDALSKLYIKTDIVKSDAAMIFSGVAFGSVILMIVFFAITVLDLVNVINGPNLYIVDHFKDLK